MSTCQTSNGPPQPISQTMGEGEEAVREAMKQYYGKELTKTEDCQTGVNCSRIATMAPHVKEAMQMVHKDITDKYFGCGLCIPEAVEGCSVLDLGSGAGRDCFAISKLVGPKGRVTGIDMTEEQLAIARQYVDYHAEKFGYSQPNTNFILGYIEKMAEAGLKENTFDLLVSNCVICLCPDKTSVLKEAFRVLKEGGELYYSDIYTDTYLPPDIKQNRVLWGEGMSGALHWQDLYRLAQEVGFSQPRLVKANPVNVSKFSDILGKAQYMSVTYRMFKLPKTASAPSAVTYKGGILGCADQLTFDRDTTFKKDEEVVADGELAAILSSSRFRQYFSFREPGDVTPTTTDPKVDPFSAAEEKTCCA